jgi:hypothetical protein
MKRLLWMMIVACLIARVCGESEINLMEIGERPRNHVFDPASLVPGTDQVVGPALASIRKNEHIDIILVIFPNLGAASPEQVARTCASSWCDPRANCIVLHVPGHPESPWLFPGGRVQQGTPAAISDPAIAAARRRAAREASSARVTIAAAMEAADLMRIWTGSTTHLEEIELTNRVHGQLARELAERRQKILLIAVTGVCLPILLGIGAALLTRSRRKSRRFPPIQWHRRLGAPHAGGCRHWIHLSSGTFPEA